MSDGPIVEEVRGRAMELSARYDHDLHQYATHLRELEAENRARVVDQITVVQSPELSGTGSKDS